MAPVDVELIDWLLSTVQSTGGIRSISIESFWRRRHLWTGEMILLFLWSVDKHSLDKKDEQDEWYFCVRFIVLQMLFRSTCRHHAGNETDQQQQKQNVKLWLTLCFDFNAFSHTTRCQSKKAWRCKLHHPWSCPDSRRLVVYMGPGWLSVMLHTWLVIIWSFWRIFNMLFLGYSNDTLGCDHAYPSKVVNICLMCFSTMKNISRQICSTRWWPATNKHGKLSLKTNAIEIRTPRMERAYFLFSISSWFSIHRLNSPKTASFTCCSSAIIAHRTVEVDTLFSMTFSIWSHQWMWTIEQSRSMQRCSLVWHRWYHGPMVLYFRLSLGSGNAYISTNRVNWTIHVFRWSRYPYLSHLPLANANLWRRIIYLLRAYPRSIRVCMIDAALPRSLCKARWCFVSYWLFSNVFREKTRSKLDSSTHSVWASLSICVHAYLTIFYHQKVWVSPLAFVTWNSKGSSNRVLLFLGDRLHIITPSVRSRCPLRFFHLVVEYWLVGYHDESMLGSLVVCNEQTFSLCLRLIPLAVAIANCISTIHCFAKKAFEQCESFDVSDRGKKASPYVVKLYYLHFRTSASSSVFKSVGKPSNTTQWEYSEVCVMKWDALCNISLIAANNQAFKSS